MTFADTKAPQGRSVVNISVKGASSVVVALFQSYVKPLCFRKIPRKKFNLRRELSNVSF